ncbi:MAG: DinB family protein, partial [Ancalomicrobiaceae bacterium]|nr:DinB family protein [Ancalomicrobiaceae bacterium]
HCFNHQTHHRGQAHMILTRLTGKAPAIDLAIYQRQRGTDRG